MAIDSGTFENPAPGVIRGGSDFSEFDAGAGIPAGLTQYDFDAGDPDSFAIVEDPEVGNYFGINTSFGRANRFWAFGYDAFDGLAGAALEHIEMLSRVWIPAGALNGDDILSSACSIFPAASWQAHGPQVNSSGPHDTRITAKTSSISQVPMAEDGRFDVWVWQRFRRLSEGGTAYGFKWKAWYGELEDEPAGWDSTITGLTVNVALGAGAIGFSGQGIPTIEGQRIAFFSFSTIATGTDEEAEEGFDGELGAPGDSELGEGANIWTPVEDEVTAWGACAEGESELALVSTGLVFRDQYDRADAQALGNGWDDWESVATDIQLVGNQVQAAAVGRKIGAARPADEVGNEDEILVQINILPDTVNTIGGVKSRWNFPTNSLNYHCRMDCRGFGVWAIVRNNSGVMAQIGTDPPKPNEWRGIRTTFDGAQIRMLKTPVLADGEDLSQDFTLILSATDGSPIITANKTGFERDQLASLTNYDEFILCSSRLLTVTGLPTGFKVQVDGRAAVAESGGSVSINVETWALPATTIKVLDASDAEKASLTPAGGVWAGDEYEFSSTEISTPWAVCEA